MARGYSSAPGASPEVDEARKPGLHKASVAMHGRSKNPYVREIIAGRADCPFGLMVTLAHDRAPAVRAAVGSNPTAARGILEHLAQDRDVEVLLAVVSNSALPEDILETLVFNRRAEVREASASRLDGAGLAALRFAPGEDAATPELREQSGGARAHGLHSLSDPSTASRPVSPFTRTAPVRGFKIPEEGTG